MALLYLKFDLRILISSVFRLRTNDSEANKKFTTASYNMYDGPLFVTRCPQNRNEHIRHSINSHYSNFDYSKTKTCTDKNQQHWPQNN